MKSSFVTVHALVSQSGWGWDDKEKHVTATDAVWDSYIAVCLGPTHYHVGAVR